MKLPNTDIFSGVSRDLIDSSNFSFCHPKPANLNEHNSEYEQKAVAMLDVIKKIKTAVTATAPTLNANFNIAFAVFGINALTYSKIPLSTPKACKYVSALSMVF